MWSECRDSNSGPRGPKPRALPPAPHPADIKLLCCAILFRLHQTIRCASLRNIVALLVGSLRSSPCFFISPPRFIRHRRHFGGSTTCATPRKMDLDKSLVFSQARCSIHGCAQFSCVTALSCLRKCVDFFFCYFINCIDICQQHIPERNSMPVLLSVRKPTIII